MLKPSIKRNILLKNIISGDTHRVDIHGEKEIDGKTFFIVTMEEKPHVRQVLLPKASFSIVKR